MRKPENYKKILKESYFFNSLTGAQISKIAAVAALVSYKKGSVVFSDGESANGFYLLYKGAVRIYKLSPNGKEQTLSYIAEGEPFGEAAVFMNKPFPAYAEAQADSKVIFIKKNDFIKILTDNPGLSLKLLGILSERLKTFANLIESLSLKEVPERLYQYLLELSKKQKNMRVKLPINKTQLAVILGTTSETLSRALAKLTKENLIKAENKYITLI